MSEASKQRDFTGVLYNILEKKENILHKPTASNMKELSNSIYKKFKGNSKTGGVGVGLPDFLYFNDDNNLLVIGEVKPEIIYHGEERYDISKMTTLNEYAINDLIHYMKPFLKSRYKVIGLAMSGDINNRYLVDTFFIKNGEIKNADINYFYEKESEYLNLFRTQETEEALRMINRTLKTVNNELRDIPTNDRPTLLAGVIIALYSGPNLERGEILKSKQRYPDESLSWRSIKNNLIPDIQTVLSETNIPLEKIKIVTNEVRKTLEHNVLENSSVLPNMIDEIYSVMDILTIQHEFDIMASFYQEFLSYATGDGQDLGIVLTPQHITELMVELLNITSGGIREGDAVLDPCLGTGTFLTSFMDFQIGKYAKNDFSKQEIIKKNNLIGLEISNSMFTLAVANMLVRGDGKAQLAVGNFFNVQDFKTPEGKKPKFGLMNPPYAQSKKESGNNYSEMEFIERLLDKVDEGYVAVIVPKSTLFKRGKGYTAPKKNIYKHHTLKAVFGMPNNLFEPTASTHTAIAVFQTDRPHLKEDEVYFYNINYDGFDLIKNTRKDLRGKWKQEIRNEILHDYKSRKVIPGKSIIITNLKDNDEWIPEAWLPIDFSRVIENEDEIFNKTIKEYALFKYKEKSGILDIEIAHNNESDPTKKEELSNKIPKNLELLDEIQKTGLNALDLIRGEGDENEEV